MVSWFSNTVSQPLKNVLPSQESFVPSPFVGQYFGKVLKTERQTFQVPLSRELHLIRHLQCLSTGAKKRFVGNIIREKGSQSIIYDNNLTQRLETRASKFTEQINDPQIVVSLARLLVNSASGEHMDWYLLSDGCYVATEKFLVTADIKQKLGITDNTYIGTHGVIQITPDNQMYVSQEMFGFGEAADKILVNVITLDEMPETDEIVVVLQKKTANDTPTLRTIYTGIIAPPFPLISFVKNPKERLMCAKWWEEHAFVRTLEK